MKKNILSMVLIMLFGVITIQANTTTIDNPKPVKAIVTQVYNMLGEYEIPDEIRGYKAEVRVAVDKGNYLRILSIETENKALEDFIKTSIDFQKLSKGEYKQGFVYRIPIEVRK